MMALTFIGFILSNSSFAGEKEINKRVQKAFEKEFAGAANIKWSTYEDYIKVDFKRIIRIMGSQNCLNW